MAEQQQNEHKPERYSKKILTFGFIVVIVAVLAVLTGIFSSGRSVPKNQEEEQLKKSTDLTTRAPTLTQDNLNMDGDAVIAEVEEKKQELQPPKTEEESPKQEDPKPDKPELLAPDAVASMEQRNTQNAIAAPQAPQQEDPLLKQRASFIATVEAQRSERFLTATVAQISLNINSEGKSSGIKEGDLDSADLELANVHRQINSSQAYQTSSRGMPDTGSQVLDVSSYQQASYEQGGDSPDPHDFRNNMRHGGQNAYTSMRNKGTWDLGKSLETPTNPYILRAGMVIPATMISGINSDLPGQIIAQVSQNVYDTATGKYLLLPQGTRLIGTYDSGVTYGQERVMIAWQRVIYPDNRALDLGAMPGSDVSGYSGFTDQVNNHWWKLITNAFLMSGVVAAVSVSVDDHSSNNNNNTSSTNMSDSLRTSLASQFGDVIAKVISRNLNVSPTLEIRPGYRFNVMVTKDISFDSAYKLFDY